MSEMSDISRQIWEMECRYSDDESANVEKTVAETWSRISAALFAPEREPAFRRRQFLDALSVFRFLPAGRFFAGAGTGRDATLFNCFVMGAIPNDMASIFGNLKEAALTLQQGGGIVTISRHCGCSARLCAALGPTHRDHSASWMFEMLCAGPSWALDRSAARWGAR